MITERLACLLEENLILLVYSSALKMYEIHISVSFSVSNIYLTVLISALIPLKEAV